MVLGCLPQDDPSASLADAKVQLRGRYGQTIHDIIFRFKNQINQSGGRHPHERRFSCWRGMRPVESLDDRAKCSENRGRQAAVKMRP